MEDIEVSNVIGEGDDGYVYAFTYELLMIIQDLPLDVVDTYLRAVKFEPGETTTKQSPSKERRMPLKIGNTKREDVHWRVKEMTTGFPDRPIIELAMRVPHPFKPDDLETHIHQKLKAAGCHIKRGGGNEWYFTSLDKLQEIYNIWFSYNMDHYPNHQEVCKIVYYVVLDCPASY